MQSQPYQFTFNAPLSELDPGLYVLIDGKHIRVYNPSEFLRAACPAENYHLWIASLLDLDHFILTCYVQVKSFPGVTYHTDYAVATTHPPSESESSENRPDKITIREAQKRVYEWAKSKGWTDREVPIPEQIALVHSELSEALEEWRNKKPLLYFSENNKPEGIASEYADVVIRIMHYCSLLEIDLAQEFIRKMDYNDTRPYRHGNKAG